MYLVGRQIEITPINQGFLGPSTSFISECFGQFQTVLKHCFREIGLRCSIIRLIIDPNSLNNFNILLAQVRAAFEDRE